MYMNADNKQKKIEDLKLEIVGLEKSIERARHSTCILHTTKEFLEKYLINLKQKRANLIMKKENRIGG